MFLKLDDNTKHLVEEISALSGIQRDVIREVWEFTLIRWVEQLTANSKKLIPLSIPFLGTVAVRYNGDAAQNDGTISPQIDAFVSLSSLFQQIIGEIHEDSTSVLNDILQKKIDNAVISISEKDG
jgi:hypothetical protein